MLPKPAFLFLLLGLPGAAFAQITLVSYTFEGTAAPVIGADRSSITWNSGGAANYVSPVFSSQGAALSVQNFQFSEYFEITLDATGYGSIALNSFRTNGSIAAPADWKIAYSLTGTSGTFTDITSYTLSSSTAVVSTTVPAIFLPDAANDNAFLVLRLIATSTARVDGGVNAAQGTVRLDNISFTATAIPESSTSALMAGAAALVLCLWHRGRRRSVRGK